MERLCCSLSNQTNTNITIELRTNAGEDRLDLSAEADDLNFVTFVTNTTLHLMHREQRLSVEEMGLLTRPVATVPRPEMEKTSSTGSKKGLSRSPGGVSTSHGNW